MAGATLRWGVTEAFDAPDWPWGLLLVNTVGSLVLGWLLAADWRGDVERLVRPAIGIGFCGSLTTVSGLSVTLAELGRDDRWGLGTGYLVATVLAGGAAVLVGARLRRSGAAA